jgi:hypothetical protein
MRAHDRKSRDEQQKARFQDEWWVVQGSLGQGGPGPQVQQNTRGPYYERGTHEACDFLRSCHQPTFTIGIEIPDFPETLRCGTRNTILLADVASAP